jgi:hypothetical protein
VQETSGAVVDFYHVADEGVVLGDGSLWQGIELLFDFIQFVDSLCSSVVDDLLERIELVRFTEEYVVVGRNVEYISILIEPLSQRIDVDQGYQGHRIPNQLL